MTARRNLIGAIGLLCLCGAACSGQRDGAVNRPLSSFRQEITSPLNRLRMRPNQTIHLPVVLRNLGNDIWISRGLVPVLASYRWMANGKVLPIEGARTLLHEVLQPGSAIPINIRVTAPPKPSEVVLAVTMVQEGVAWFMSKGGDPLLIPVELVNDEIVPSNVPLSSFSHEITSTFNRLIMKPSETISLPVTIRNNSGDQWSSRGKYPVLASYWWFKQGKLIPIEGKRTGLHRTVRPGEAVSLPIEVAAPPFGGDLILKITLVQEGVAWFFSKGATPLEIPVALK